MPTAVANHRPVDDTELSIPDGSYRVEGRTVEVTLLGSGDAIGMPVPLCDCEYCLESEPRCHPALLVETASTTLVLDAGPTVPEALRHVGATTPDAFLVTHAHRDHAWGLFRLLAPAKFPADFLAAVDGFDATDPETHTADYAVYLTETAHEHLREVTPLRRLDVRRLVSGEPVVFGSETPDAGGDVTVTPFAVDHARPAYDTLGFVVEANGRALGYAPDMLGFVDAPPEADLDLFVTEGAGVLDHPIHGPPEERRAAVAAVDAARTVLVNVNEHVQRAHTDELRERATALGYELGRDFASYELE